MDFMSALQQTDNLTKTENGALGFRSTFNPLLDFNFELSNYRNYLASSDTILNDWKIVLGNTSVGVKNAIKYSFFLRDPREGLGERTLGRLCFRQNFIEHSELMIPLIPLMAEYGRWDDLIDLLDYFVAHKGESETYLDIVRALEHEIRKQWLSDIHNYRQALPISIMAKWLPSINSHSPGTKHKAYLVIHALGLGEKEYRKLLSTFREYLNVVEVNLSAKDYDRIDYSQVPSKAALLYRRAFLRNDPDRYMDYLDKLEKGETKVNASVTAPHEIVHAYLQNTPWWRAIDIKHDTLLEEAWKKIPCEDISSTLVIRDGSGSMTSQVGNSNISAIDISTALAIYFAEHNKGQFKDKFITFSSRPKFIDLSKCDSLKSKIEVCMNEDDMTNTNLEATFDLILDTAVKYDLKQEDLPENLLIVSDMQFDYACTNSNHDALMRIIDKKFQEKGYKLPRLVFWNVIGGYGRDTVFPEVEGNICLLSGFSQNNYKMIMSGEIDPWACLLNVINGPRYDAIDQIWEENLK